jgi:hypothetical protein
MVMITLKLTEQMMGIILGTLAKQPFEAVYATIAEIQRQIQEQRAQPGVAADAAKEAT